jgi:flagellar hook-associated protein 1 FlgK
MSLSQALAAAVSGLHANQAGLSLVAGNIANANTPGYVRKTVNQVSLAGDNTGVSVRVAEVQRQLDQYVQKQLRTENAGASYASLRSQFYQQLQQIYGQPGSDTALDATFNNFASALQSLVASPDDSAARNGVMTTAQLLAQQLNSMSSAVQTLRSNAELGISDAVNSANQAMQAIANLNQQIGTSTVNDSTFATLLDQRDAYVDQLSQLMDINVVPGEHNQIQVFTTSGMQLVGLKASTLSFDTKGAINAESQWDADPTKRSVGTITLTSPNGGKIDLIQTNAIRSGQIAAYLQLRDQDLVQAQNQLDAIASSMAQALSDTTKPGATVTGPPDGFDLDLGSLSDGNTVSVSYTDRLTNAQRSVTFVRVSDSSILPLSNTATADPNDTVYGIDFSAGMGSVISQINAALATTGMTASNPVGNTLRLLDAGPAGRVTINAASTTSTVTSLTSGSNELPFFVDGNVPYTGAFDGSGPQSVGFAGRINVNAALLADPSKLVVYQAGVSIGDAARPTFLLNQLTSGSLTFNPNSGIGNATAPYSGTLGNFVREMISKQGETANMASTLKQGQDVVLNSLQQRFADSSSVNIDQEMTNLLNLQNSYAANARVMSAVKDMMDLLLQI